jgi:hypothetical protein
VLQLGQDAQCNNPEGMNTLSCRLAAATDKQPPPRIKPLAELNATQAPAMPIRTRGTGIHLAVTFCLLSCTLRTVA